MTPFNLDFEKACNVVYGPTSAHCLQAATRARQAAKRALESCPEAGRCLYCGERLQNGLCPNCDPEAA
jgi:hypothetical protein